MEGIDVDHAPRLVGECVTLRPLEERDIAGRARFGKSREVNRGFGGDLDQDGPLTEAEAGVELGRRFGPGPHWVIADEADAFLGTVRLAPVDVHNRSATFGIGIYDQERLGQGLGSEATRLAVRYGFEGLGLHRIQLTVLADNLRAVGVYQKCGFITEGRLRETLFRDGAWHDDLAMSILAHEWAERDR